jgi:hypothetical protein
MVLMTWLVKLGSKRLVGPAEAPFVLPFVAIADVTVVEREMGIFEK